MDTLDLMLDDAFGFLDDEPAPEVVAPRPSLRVYMGQTITNAMLKAALGIKDAAAQLVERWTENRVEEHKNGGVCPHCRGSGRYMFHTDPKRNERCFRCNGKGHLNERDLAFLQRRVGGAAPICLVSSAPVA